jgi:DNA-binding transcriptional ArsR family regulator
VEDAARALAEPRRREILRLVRADERSAGEIAAHFDVTRPAISQHLRVLKEAGLVVERRDGTRRLYRLRPEGLTELRAFLEELWAERLTRLKHTIEWDQRRARRAKDQRHGRDRPDH